SEIQTREFAPDFASFVAPRPRSAASTGAQDDHWHGTLFDTQKCVTLTHRLKMRTNIDIDDRLMRQAMRSSSARTKRAVVEEALRLLIQTRGQSRLRRLRGQVAWNGDLDTSRLERQAKKVRGHRRHDPFGRTTPRRGERGR